MHIVAFPGWYPSRLDKLSGDFIQRHFRAISQYCKITVILPFKDSSIKKSETIIVKTSNLTEIYCYYPSVSSLKWLDNLLSFLRYNYICLTKVIEARKKEKIDIVHIYTIQKNHLVGPLLQYFYKFPYVVSEQSTLYVDGRFENMKKLQKKVFKYVFEKASSYHAVSKYLGNSIKNKLQLNSSAVVIQNVVDGGLFYYKDHLLSNPITFVHVSNMVYQKNVEGMLHAFAEVKKENENFILNLVGPLPISISSLIITLNLSDNIKIWHEQTYQEVASIMQQSDAFVFFTRYETFGCVIIEANACGLPIIVTDMEVTREIVTNNYNGLFVKNEDINDLSEKILFLMNNYEKFDRILIAKQTVDRFNYSSIGQEFAKWYSSVRYNGLV